MLRRMVGKVAVLWCMSLLLALCALPMTRTSSASSLRNVSVCMLYANTMNDLGFTYTGNIARRVATQQISELYPNISITVSVLLDCAAYTAYAPDYMKALTDMITTHNCTLVFGLSNVCLQVNLNTSQQLHLMRDKYPDVAFVEYNNGRYFNSSTPPSLPNYKGAGVSLYASWYAAGAVAGVDCRRCIGFVHPLKSTIVVVNAFHRGMQYGFGTFGSSRGRTTMCPIYALSTGAFLDVGMEGLCARQFVEKGCDIVAYWADSQTISSYVASLRNTTVFSIPNNVDGSKFWGDSVMTSVFTDFSSLMSTYMQDAVRNVPAAAVPARYVTPWNGSNIAAFSPRVTRQATRAGLTAYRNQKQNYTVWCGGFVAATGSVVNTGCQSDAAYATFSKAELGVIWIPNIKRETTCPAGTYASYSNLSTNLTLSCVHCPSGTVSETAGSFTCVSCPFPTEPNSNRTACVFVQASKASLTASDAAAYIIAPIAVFLIVVGGVGFAFRRHVSRLMSLGRRWESLSPPAGPLVGAVLVAVNPHRSVPQWRNNVDLASRVFEVLEGAVWEACRCFAKVPEQHVYPAFSMGDVYILTAASLEAAVSAARMLEQRFREDSVVGDVMALRVMIGSTELLPTVSHHNAQWEDDDAPQTAVESCKTGPSMVSSKDNIPKSSSDGSIGGVTNAYRSRFRRKALEELLQGFAAWRSDVAASSLIFLPSAWSVPSSVANHGDPRIPPAANLGGVCESDWIMWRRACLAKVQPDLRFSVLSWPTRSNPSLSVSIAIPWTSTAVSSQQSAAVMGSNPSGSAPPGGRRASLGSSGAAPNGSHTSANSTSSDEAAMCNFDAIMLSDKEMYTLRKFGFWILKSFLGWLESSQRKQLVRDSASRLHVRLNAMTARRKDSASNKIFFGEDQVIGEVTTQVLRSMDEQELLWWMRDTVMMRTGEHADGGL